MHNFRNQVRNTIIPGLKTDMIKTLKFQHDPEFDKRTTQPSKSFKRRGTHVPSINERRLDVVEEQNDLQNSVITSTQLPVQRGGVSSTLKKSGSQIVHESNKSADLINHKEKLGKASGDHNAVSKTDEFLPRLKASDHPGDLNRSLLKPSFEKSKDQAFFSLDIREASFESAPKTSILDKFLDSQNKKRQVSKLNKSANSPSTKRSIVTSPIYERDI